MMKERRLFVQDTLMKNIGAYFEGQSAGDFVFSTGRVILCWDGDPRTEMMRYIAEQDDMGDIYINDADDDNPCKKYVEVI